MRVARRPVGATLPLAGQAHEGFWPFNSAIKQSVGVELTDAWLRPAGLGLLSSGLGAFVSPDGLVLTNHHVSLDSS